MNEKIINKTILIKRSELIVKIMKKNKYKNGMLLKELNKEIEMHLSFYELFGKTNSKNWEAKVRQILQQGDPNMYIFSNKGKYFFRIYKGCWTFYGNSNYKKQEQQKKEILEENKFKKIDDFLKNISEEEKKILVKQRLNQTKFRKFLKEEFLECPFKNISNSKLLIASHIVDYSKCKDEQEKANPYNGLLLSPDVDKLFDRKMITFNEKTGIINIFPEFVKEAKKLGINNKMKIPNEFLTISRKYFLKERNKQFKNIK